MRPALPVLAVLLASALAPLGAAQASPGLVADLVFQQGPHLRGEGAFASADASLDLSALARADGVLALTWERATGYDVRTEWEHVALPDPLFLRGLPQNRSLELGPGGLESVACGERCLVLVVGLGDETTRVSVAGRLDGPLRLLADKRPFWAEYPCRDRADAFYHELPRGSFAVGGENGTLLHDARTTAEGRLGLLLVDAGAVARSTEGRVELGTIRRTTPVEGPGAVRVGSRIVSGFAYLELEGARLDPPRGGDVGFLAPAPRLDLDGQLSAPSVSGTVTHAGATMDVERVRLLLEGPLTLLPEAPEPGLETSGCFRQPPDVQRAGPPLRARVEGDPHVVYVGAQAMSVAASVAPAAAAAVGLTVAAALGAAAFWMRHVLLAPFYSRITRSGVLDNDRRQEIHELLARRPGSTPSDLARATGLARAVVQHHLRMLETHHLVVSRREGRRSAYFLVGHVPPAPVHLGQAALRDPSRKRIAELVAGAAEPLTRTALVEATGLSPRLVSYHLAQLEDTGLVVHEGRMPRRYRPTPLLAEALHGPPGPGGAAGAGAA